jgi:hypothetical protein
MVCGTKGTGYLHMDDRWLWRYFILDPNGNVAAISKRTYFSWAEAEAALKQLLE